MNRIKEEECLVPNPMNTKQVSRISLKPQDVEAIVFWSKNPAPMLPYLEELDRLGFRYYFQFTINDYPTKLEPNIPNLDERLDTFLNLCRHVGPMRVIWRYDPIILSNVTDAEFHLQRFGHIAEELKGSTSRVMVSIVDYYQKTDRRLRALEQDGFVFDKEAASGNMITKLLGDLAAIASQHGMEITSCAEEHDFSDIGIPPGRCIDPTLVSALWSLHLPYKKDTSQRKHCNCTSSRDIGINDTCIHGCLYCYSTRNHNLAQQRYQEHDPNSPALAGHPNVPTKPSSCGQMKLFS